MEHRPFDERTVADGPIGRDAPQRLADMAPVIVADPRCFMLGCLIAWLDKFARGLAAVATRDAVRTVNGGATPAPAAVILSASAQSAGKAWLHEQAAGIRRAFPEVPILVIWDDTAEMQGDEFIGSMDYQGVISMTNSPEVASAVLRLVMAGGRYLPTPPPAPHSRHSAGSVPVAPRHPSAALNLTPREQAVCELLAAGLCNKTIARRLGMAVSTVKIHVHHILKKLALESRTEVAILMTAESHALTSRSEGGLRARNGAAADASSPASFRSA